MAIQKWYGLDLGLGRNLGTLADSSRTSRDSVTLDWLQVAAMGEHSGAKATLLCILCPLSLCGRFLEPTRTLRLCIYLMGVTGAENTHIHREGSPKSKLFCTSISFSEVELRSFRGGPGFISIPPTISDMQITQALRLGICPKYYQRSCKKYKS